MRGDAFIVQRLEYLPDILVMIDHGVVVWTLPASRLTDAFWLGVGPEVHVSGVHPDKEWFIRSLLPLDEIHSPIGDVIIDRDHPCLG
jgi:hypothetical protein